MTAQLRTVSVGDINLSVTSDGAGPAIILLHGFPEIAYSWRHQIPALVDAGYRVLAPDLRGYGWSDVPADSDAYGIFDLVGDVIALLDAEDIDDAVMVGHDWGAIIAPWVALFRPDRVRGLALLSVPYQPRGDASWIEHIKATDPEGEFDYMVAFQAPGLEEFLDADPIAFLRGVYWSVAGSRPHDFTRGDETPPGLPRHLSEGDFENYCRAFARTGLGAPINYYRNLHRNWELTRPWHGAPLTAPTLFLGGTRDFVCTTADGALGASVASMQDNCRDLRGSTLIEGAGHWLPQEAPDEVNAHLLAFLAGLE